MSDLFVGTVDITTLAFARGLVQCILGGLLLYLGTRAEDAPGARLWAIGFFLNGMSLFVFPLNVPPAWETPRTIVNHVSLAGSSVFLLLGFWAFGGQRILPWILGLLIAIPAFSLVAWELAWPNSRWRILTTISGQLLFYVALQHSLQKAPRVELSRFYRHLRYAVIAYAVFFLWSYGSLFEVLPITARADQGYHRAIFSITTLIFMLTLAVGCLALQFVLITARYADLARHDLLTGVLNRRGFFEAAAELGTSTGSLIALDIDHFKQINDGHGHAAGDRVLEHLGKILNELTGEHVVVARTGGEEFCLLLAGNSAGEATILAERIRARCAETRIQAANGDIIGFTVSVGVSALDPSTSLDQSLADADRALYLAKSDGRNRVRTADRADGQDLGSDPRGA